MSQSTSMWGSSISRRRGNNRSSSLGGIFARSLLSMAKHWPAHYVLCNLDYTVATGSPNPRASQGSYRGAVGIVASAGGITALSELLGRLEGAFPLPIFVAQHLPRSFSNLDLILSTRCRLRVRWDNS